MRRLFRLFRRRSSNKVYEDILRATMHDII